MPLKAAVFQLFCSVSVKPKINFDPLFGNLSEPLPTLFCFTFDVETCSVSSFLFPDRPAISAETAVLTWNRARRNVYYCSSFK
jgi:hypothetical protein